MKTKLILLTLSLAGLISVAGQETVLMVVGNAAAPNASDTALQTHLLSYGYNVQLVTDSGSTTADATGKALVIISSTVGSANVADKFLNVAVPVVNWEALLEDDFLFASDFGTTSAGQTDIIITDAQHPLAGGLSAGTHKVTKASLAFTYGFPGGTVSTVATLADFSDWPCVFGYDQGATLNDGSTKAAARRVQLFLTDDAFVSLTADGLKLVDGALAWAMKKANLGTQTTVTLTQPTNNAAFAANANITLTAVTTGPVTKVEFYEGANKLGEATSSPYTLTWTNVATGRYQLTAKLINTNVQITSATVKIAVGNVTPQVLMVVGDANMLQSGDAALKVRLESYGYDVLVVDDSQATTNDAAGVALVVVTGEYVDANTVGDKFRDVPVPVVNCGAATEPNFLMTGSTAEVDFGTLTSQTEIIITDAQHPMAGGLSAGVHTVGSASLDMTYSWGVPGSTAKVVATLSDGTDRPCIYGYDTGALLVDGTTPAPARRVQVYLHNRNAYSTATAEGVKLVDAVLAWALNKTSMGTLPTVSLTQPVNGASFIQGSNIQLTATAASTGGQVVRVEFYANTTNKLGQATSSPYTLTWSNAPLGNYRLTARVIDSNGFRVDSSPANIQVGATAPRVLMLYGKANTTASDAALKQHLESFGMAVEMVNDIDCTTADAAGKVLVVISSTVSSVNVGDKFRSVDVPLINHEWGLQDNLLFTTDLATDRGYTTTSETDILITDATHPLAAGLTEGQHTVETAGVQFSWGIPVSSAKIIATLADGSGSPCLYCFEKGALLVDGVTPAPARRVHSFDYDNGFASFTPEGLALFDAQLKWVLPALANPPSVSLTQPTNGATFSANANIVLTAAVSGSVTRVDFYQGSTLIGQAINSPFNVTWSNVPAGTYQLTARAVDTSGFSATSASVEISVGTVSSYAVTIVQNAGSDFIAWEGESVSAITNVAASAASFVVTNDAAASASGGQALYTAGANQLNAPRSIAFYALKFRTPGTYTLYHRWRASTAATDQDPTMGNSFQVPIGFGNLDLDNDANRTTSTSNNTRTPPDSNNYAMFKETQTFTVTQAQINVGQALMFKIAVREFGFYLDRLAMSLNSGLTEADFNAMPNSGILAAPAISLTQPSNGSTFTANTNIVLAASVTGSAARVEFYAGANLLGQVTSSPYSLTWSNVPAGSYQLTAAAIDASGLTGISQPVNIVVNPSSGNPAIAFVGAAQNIVLSTNVSVTLANSAGDAIVVAVREGSALGSDITSGMVTDTAGNTYTLVNTASQPAGNRGSGLFVATNVMAAASNTITFTWKASTTIAIVAQAFANVAGVEASATGTSEPTSVTTFNSGSLVTSQAGELLVFETAVSADQTTWTAGAGYTIPANGSNRRLAMEYMVAGAPGTYSASITGNAAGTMDGVFAALLPAVGTAPTVTLTQPANEATFTAHANIVLTATVGGSAARVDFYANGTAIGQATGSPYSITWNDVAAGTYQLTARATGANGLSGVSPTVDIVVNPSSETPGITFVGAAQNIVQSTNVSVTLANNAGDAIVVAVREGSAPGSQIAAGMVTDTAGNTYTLVNTASQPAGNRGSGLFVATNVVAAASNTVTFTWKASTTIAIVAQAFANVAGVEASATGTSEPTSVTTFTSGSLVTSQAGELLVFETAVSADQATWTAGAGYTIPANGSNRRLAMEYMVAEAPGTYSASITGNAAGTMDGVFAALLPVAVPSAPIICQTPDSDHIAWEGESVYAITNVTGSAASFVVTNDATASAGQALYTAGANQLNAPRSVALYELKFATPGTYTLYHRWRASTLATDQDPTMGNSFQVPIGFGNLDLDNDANRTTSASNNTRTPPDSNNYAMFKETQTFTVTQAQVDAGQPLIFKIAVREFGFYLDRLVMSLNSGITEAEFNALPDSGINVPNVNLAIARVDTNLVLSWPVSAQGFSLETTDSLAEPNWEPVTATVNVVSGQNTVTLPMSDNAAFYRLKK